MSASLTLVNLTTHASTQLVALAPAGSGDIFSKMNTMASSATGSAKLGGGLLAVLFVVITGWKVRGAIAGVIAGFIAAALFGWAVNNVSSTDVTQPITDTIKGAPAVPAAPSVPGQTSLRDPAAGQSEA